MTTTTKDINGIEEACKALKQAQDAGHGLLVLTGAGMSVSSKVPVFRNADGSMSKEFLAFLSAYNKARARHGLPEADDWFSFSVPEMFQKETAKEAWAYWRWRILRAQVERLGDDYLHLQRILNTFGPQKSFVVTSNCDGLHVQAGVDEACIQEVHGSLSRVQCSAECCDRLWPVDDAFLARLKEEPDWVPMCPACNQNCLRPNVMIFSDYSLVYSVLQKQKNNLDAFRFRQDNERWIVLEIGAGVVVASIRYQAENLASQGKGLIRINPSQSECEEMQTKHHLTGKYWPVVATSSDALQGLADAVIRPEKLEK